ncbi:MAG: hypothetical protein ABIO51_02400 [Solirubrobacteraceae bacterium]
MIVRPATLDDAGEIADVQTRTWLDAYAGWVFEANTQGRGFYERMGWVWDGGPSRPDLWAPELRYRRAL